ncbi:rod shape-determining protein MreC [Patescibacteria group bacterium]|nr:rod shape-determining protein MreC [Patescibacteria group bacterium]
MEKARKRTLATIIIIVILLIFFHYTGLFHFIEQTAVKLFMPVQTVFYSWGNKLNQLTHLNSINEENQRLKERIGRLSIDYLKLSSLETENEYLRAELDFLKKEKYQYQSVNILGRLPTDNQILILDKGASSGLKEGQAVTAAQGVIVGKILKAEEDIAYAMLLTDIKSKLAVSLADFSDTSGLLVGQTGSSLLMDLIPYNQEIKIGDIVVTSNLEESIPTGLVVGEVSQIDSTLGEIFKQAKITPFFSYQNLQSLTIIVEN